MIDKNELKQLYVENKLTTREIAKIYNVDKKTISRWLKNHKIPINFEKRKFEKSKKRSFSNRQKQIIVGTLLGDGCIAKHGLLSRLMLGQCEKQKDFLIWKANELGINKVYVREDKRGNSIMYVCNSYTHTYYEALRKKFYINNVKTIPSNIANYLTPLSVAVWYMDDGTLQNKTSMQFCTDGFSYRENQFLKDALKVKFDVNFKICGYKRRNKEYFFLRANKRNSIILAEKIAQFIVPSMLYKLPHRVSTTKCETSHVEGDIV